MIAQILRGVRCPRHPHLLSEASRRDGCSATAARVAGRRQAYKIGKLDSFLEERGFFPLSRQCADGVGPGLDHGPDGIVLVGREPDGRPGEGDVIVITRRVVALELAVVGLSGAVPHGLAAHRSCEGRIREHLRGVRLEGGDRRGLQGDVAHPLALTVEEVHLRGVVLAVPDDRIDGDAIRAGIPDAPEGVVLDDALDEVVKRRYGGDRDCEVPDRRFVHGLLHEVCHGWYLLTAQPSGAVPSRKMRSIFLLGTTESVVP